MKENDWVPCKERMPEIGVWVLVYTRASWIITARCMEQFEPNNYYRWYYRPSGQKCSLQNVIAWMPLPPPYKGKLK